MNNRANFKSKVGIILATVGSAVGLGNVWRFPYITGENGGAAFLIIYALCVVLLGIPCMVNEFIIGRSAQANTARAFTKMADGRPWKWIGYLSVFTGFAITCYYAIVSGWCFHYIFAPFMSDLSTPQLVEEHFATFSGSPYEPVFWALALILICHFTITRGVQKGIEKMSKLFMPMLFILLLIIVVSSCLLPGAVEGLKFLFLPDFSKITANSVLAAMGQSFYSLSIAMGCVCTYASYFSRETNLTRTAVQISILDSAVAILAGMMIFPAAFAVGVRPDAGASLVFVTLPNVFNQAFSAIPFLGTAVSVAFYTLLSIAALTSLISLHEVATAFVEEEVKVSRRVAASIVTIIAMFIGIFCSLSLGDRSWLTFGGTSLFDIFDYTTGQILLPIIGFLTCIFLGWFGPHDRIRAEYTNDGTFKGAFFKCYLFLIKFFCPTAILLVFLNQLGIL